MPANVNYASSDSYLESLVLHILPDFGETGDGITNSNMLTAMLKEHGSYETVEGGLEFWYGVSKAENSNFKWQGKNDDMLANSQDPEARLRWDPKVFTGSLVLNALDKARNKGRAAIKDWLKTLRGQAATTIKNQFNSAWWKATPVGDDPESVPSLISTTPTTGTIGGLSRVNNTYLQNGLYSTAIADIGSEAGIADLERIRIQNAVGTSTADIIIMDQIRFGNLVGYLANLMRYTPNDKMAQLRIPTIQIGTATIGFENLSVLGGANTIVANRMYGINSEFMKIKRLKGESDDGWEKAFERVNKSLNKAVYYNWFGNLIVPTPRGHWVATNVS